MHFELPLCGLVFTVISLFDVYLVAFGECGFDLLYWKRPFSIMLRRWDLLFERELFSELVRELVSELVQQNMQSEGSQLTNSTVVVVEDETPLPPGAPPPYSSLQFEARQGSESLSDQSPPSYDEAVRTVTST